MTNGKKMTIDDLMKKRNLENLGQVSKGVYKVKFLSCGHIIEAPLASIKKIDFECKICSKEEYQPDPDKYKGMSKEDIIKNSKFTVGYDGDNLGSMIISTSSIDSISPERGYYQALYNEPRNNPKIVKNLQFKMEELGLYKRNLYDDSPKSVFGSQLSGNELENYLNDYNKQKRVNAAQGKECAFVMPKVVREKGVKALKAHKTANKK